MARLPRLLRLTRLARDARGTASIELALLAPILALMVMGIVDLANGLARKHQLEQATYRALELVTVGSLQSDYAYLKPEIAQAAAVPEDNVTVENWLECEGARKSDFDDVCTSGQHTARFVKVAVFDDFVPIFSHGPLGVAYGRHTDGSVRLTARSTLRVQ